MKLGILECHIDVNLCELLLWNIVKLQQVEDSWPAAVVDVPAVLSA